MSEERYVDPNSGAAPQPGGYAAEPVQESGQFDAAVADEVTEAQEADKASEAHAKKAPAKKAAAKKSSHAAK